MILDLQASKGQKDLTDLTYEEFENINDLMKSCGINQEEQNKCDQQVN